MRELTIHIPDSKDMSTESETGINMPTSSPDYKKAALSSREGSATYAMHRRSFLGGSGNSWDLAKATMAMTLASLTDGALADHYTHGFQLSWTCGTERLQDAHWREMCATRLA